MKAYMNQEEVMESRKEERVFHSTVPTVSFGSCNAPSDKSVCGKSTETKDGVFCSDHWGCFPKWVRQELLRTRNILRSATTVKGQAKAVALYRSATLGALIWASRNLNIDWFKSSKKES